VSKNKKKEQKSLKNLSNFKKTLFPTSKPESTSRICVRQSTQEKKKIAKSIFRGRFSQVKTQNFWFSTLLPKKFTKPKTKDLKSCVTTPQ
jgi:hypothetical protein